MLPLVEYHHNPKDPRIHLLYNKGLPKCYVKAQIFHHTKQKYTQIQIKKTLLHIRFLNIKYLGIILFQIVIKMRTIRSISIVTSFSRKCISTQKNVKYIIFEENIMIITSIQNPLLKVYYL